MTEPEAAAASGGASFFGKLPEKRDFVRIRHSYPAALAFDEWVNESVAHGAERGSPLIPPVTRFWFARPETSLVGALSPSRDRAGRRFPAAVFAPLPTRVLAADQAAALLAGGPDLNRAVKLLAAYTGRERPPFDGLQSALDALGRGEEACQPKVVDALLERQVAADLFERLQVEGARALAALRAFAASAEAGPRSVLDAPAPDELSAAFWLRAVRSLLRWPPERAFSVFWTDRARLLISLQAPPAGLLSWSAGTGGKRVLRLDAPQAPAEVDVGEALRWLKSLGADANTAVVSEGCGALR